MKFNHDIFFDSYRDHFGPIKAQSTADGIENILTMLEADDSVTDERSAAYMFATVKHECANTWHPIEEYGKGKSKPYGASVKVKGTDGKDYNCSYYGRGYVQLTWQTNYAKMSQAIRHSDVLLIHPEEALDREVAYKIMSYGMRSGSFTGKKLSDYINETACDYIHARRIINGVDKAELIGGYALNFEQCFVASKLDEPQIKDPSAVESGIVDG
jgi:putative chitinase